MTRQELKAERAKLLTELLEKSKTSFAEESKAIFQKFPKLESFRWTQYTPYFNDGDECTFSVNAEEMDFVFDGKEHAYVSKWGLKDEEDKEFASAARACLDLMATYDEDELKDMFGDHAEIKVTSSGVEVEQYSHD